MGDDAKAAEKRRLAAALRANLRRRKQAVGRMSRRADEGDRAAKTEPTSVDDNRG